MRSRNYSWWDKAAALLFVIFCFELGVFLIFFPWLQAWDHSFFSNLDITVADNSWERIWDSPWTRGAVSGLGLTNVLISFIEVYRLRYFAEQDRAVENESALQ